MELLKERIRRDGKVKGTDVLKAVSYTHLKGETLSAFVCFPIHFERSTFP